MNEISRMRQGVGWSQQELARRLGVHQATVSRAEAADEPRQSLVLAVKQVIGAVATSTDTAA